MSKTSTARPPLHLIMDSEAKSTMPVSNEDKRCLFDESAYDPIQQYWGQYICGSSSSRDYIYNIIKKELALPCEEAATVDWQEKYLDKLDRDIGDMKASLRATEERISQMVGQTLAELRDRDNQRHTEFLALRSDNRAIFYWVIGMVISAIGLAVAAIYGIFRIS